MDLLGYISRTLSNGQVFSFLPTGPKKPTRFALPAWIPRISNSGAARLSLLLSLILIASPAFSQEPAPKQTPSKPPVSQPAPIQPATSQPTNAQPNTQPAAAQKQNSLDSIPAAEFSRIIREFSEE